MHQRPRGIGADLNRNGGDRWGWRGHRCLLVKANHQPGRNYRRCANAPSDQLPRNRRWLSSLRRRDLDQRANSRGDGGNLLVRSVAGGHALRLALQLFPLFFARLSRELLFNGQQPPARGLANLAAPLLLQRPLLFFGLPFQERVQSVDIGGQSFPERLLGILGSQAANLGAEPLRRLAIRLGSQHLCYCAPRDFLLPLAAGAPPFRSAKPSSVLRPGTLRALRPIPWRLSETRPTAARLDWPHSAGRRFRPPDPVAGVPFARRHSPLPVV